MPLKETAKKCNAMSKRTKKPCQNPAVSDFKVCRMHGGKTPVGTASVHFVTGKFSKHLPKGVAGLYERSLNDRELTEHRDSIALVDAFLGERLDKLYNGESKDFWKILKGKFKQLDEDFASAAHLSDELTQEREEKNQNHKQKKRKTSTSSKSSSFSLTVPSEEIERIRSRIRENLKEIKNIVDCGLTTYFVFENVQPFLEQRRRITESENRRMEKLGVMIPVEKAFAMVARLADIVKQYVTEPEQLRQISRELAQSVTTS